MITAFILACVGALMLSVHWRTHVLEPERTLELGDAVSEDIHDYLDSFDFILEHARIDAGGVNNMCIGTYGISVRSFVWNWDYLVIVVDTTPPALEVGIEYAIISTEENYTTGLFQAHAEDLSGVATLRMEYDGITSTILHISEIGEYSVRIIATDRSGNETDRIVGVLVDTPPRLIGVHDQYVLKGSDIYDLAPVFAIDDVDGFWYEDIGVEVDSGGDAVFSKPGEYRVSYYTMDTYGLEGRENAVIHVVDSIAEAAEHAYDYELPREDRGILVENGYYRTPPLEVPDRTATIAAVNKSLVNIYRKYDQGDLEYSSGSGFILDIDADYVYIASVDHVCSHFEGDRVSVMFPDDSTADIYMHSIRLSDANEAALFAVPVGSLSYATLSGLRQVYYDPAISEEMVPGMTILKAALNMRGGEEDCYLDTSFISMHILDYQRFSESDDAYYITTRAVTPGMSGTGCFDLRARLVGIVSEAWDDVILPDTDNDLQVGELWQLLDRKEEVRILKSQ